MSAYQERERARKRIYEQHRLPMTCCDCGSRVSKAAIRCVRCHLKHARRRLTSKERLRLVGNRTPTRGELRLIRRTPPVPTPIFQGLAIIEKWQREP
jgi:hypothetical protein